MSAQGPVTVVVVTGVLKLQRCGLYAHWSAIVDAHHVVPESWWRKAGVPVQSPLMSLCPVCHMNTHAGIDGLLRGTDVTILPPRVQALAQRAITDGIAAGLTPRPTL
jgi:hypothetical protein